MPISFSVRITRIAISPRFATKTLENMAAEYFSGRGARPPDLTGILPALMIELQSHSTFSDGELEPRGVVEAAAEAGVKVLALTDHDAIAGVPLAEGVARELGLEVVPAVEMSCVHEFADDLHMLGYWVDLEKIAPACERAQQERIHRAEEIIENLRSHGFDINLVDAIAEAGDALSVGRPHIAKAAGAKPEEMGAFFEEYLVPGAKAFVPRRWPTAEEAVRLIHDAGGAAVVAHPFWDVKDPAQVRQLVEALDIEGAECFYPSHDEEQTRFLVDLCKERDLEMTGSSDFHGPNHKIFPRFGAYETFGLGDPAVPAKPAR
jgi:predicted metal-dependent phosphoesterase TrpH